MGARGRVSIPIATKPGTAKGGGDDYDDIDEILLFENGENRYNLHALFFFVHVCSEARNIMGISR